MATDQKAELRPCPFCGSEPYVHEPDFNGDDWQIGCNEHDDLGGVFLNGKTWGEVVERWNLRALLEAEEESGATLPRPTKAYVRAVLRRVAREGEFEEADVEVLAGFPPTIKAAAPEPEPEEGEPEPSVQARRILTIEERIEALEEVAHEPKSIPIGNIMARLQALEERTRDNYKEIQSLQHDVYGPGAKKWSTPEPDSEPEPEEPAAFLVWWCVVRLHEWARGRITDEELLDGKEHIRDATKKALRWTQDRGLHWGEPEPERDEGGEDRRSIHDDEVLPKEKDEGRGLVELIVKLHDGGWQVCSKDFAALMVGKELARVRLRSRPSEDAHKLLQKGIDVSGPEGLHEWRAEVDRYLESLRTKEGDDA